VLGRSRFTLTRAIVKLYSLLLQGFVNLLKFGTQNPIPIVDQTVSVSLTHCDLVGNFNGVNLRIMECGEALAVVLSRSCRDLTHECSFRSGNELIYTCARNTTLRAGGPSSFLIDPPDI
jgi:hypothetical protein